jgi:hypothetical protein
MTKWESDTPTDNGKSSQDEIYVRHTECPMRGKKSGSGDLTIDGFKRQRITVGVFMAIFSSALAICGATFWCYGYLSDNAAEAAKNSVIVHENKNINSAHSDAMNIFLRKEEWHIENQKVQGQLSEISAMLRELKAEIRKDRR